MTNQLLLPPAPFDGNRESARRSTGPADNTPPLLQPTGRAASIRSSCNGSAAAAVKTHITYLWHTVHGRHIRRHPPQGSRGSGGPVSGIVGQYDYPCAGETICSGSSSRSSPATTSTPKNPFSRWSVARVEGNGATNWSTVKTINANWVAEKKIKVLAQWALRRNPRTSQCSDGAGSCQDRS